MVTQTISEKSLSQRPSLKREVALLRSLAISIVGKDEEGTYHPEFVKEMFHALRERPSRKFTTPEAFLSEISRA